MIFFDGPHILRSSVKEVSFVYSKGLPPDKETLTTAPYITDGWKKHSVNQPIQCIVVYEVWSCNNKKLFGLCYSCNLGISK